MPPTELQAAKALVRKHNRALEGAFRDDVAVVLAENTAPDWHWRGMHPWDERHGADAVAETFWQPYLTSFTSVRRRPDIFFAGESHLDAGGVWVVEMGHLMALWDASFLGVAPTRKIAMLRFAEFNRVEGGRIVETAFFCDLLHLLRQGGHQPLTAQTARHLIQPGPATHDGLLYDDADPAEGETTLALIEKMIGDINRHERFDGPEKELARTWSDDMIWWGPEGIGATFTIPRYIEQHQRPFRDAMETRLFNGHLARLAEGCFGGFFGWPNLTLTPKGRYLGQDWDGTVQADMRVIDIYRRDGDRLAENWIFIDIPHFLKAKGVDVLLPT